MNPRTPAKVCDHLGDMSPPAASSISTEPAREGSGAGRILTGMYKPTLFDRHGPDATDYIRAVVFGAMVFGLTLAAIVLAAGGMSWLLFVASLSAGVAAGSFALLAAKLAGGTWKKFTVDGSSTPYIEQYSYQQALVMQGKIDEALESFEAIIAAKPDRIDARIRAAELCASKKNDHTRAANLFRDAQRVPAITAGEDVYVSNRLVDLYLGPLGDPPRALAQLRRLIDKYPTSAAAARARDALAALKRELIVDES